MRKIYSFLTLCLALTFTQCSSPLDPYPMDKKYWDAKDYDEVLTYIKFRLPDGDQYPNLKDALTAPVFQKLANLENLTVVIEDTGLGLKHRGEFAGEMHKHVNTMTELYTVMDREDKYVYDEELARILNFDMYLEVNYFSLGNDAIRQEMDKADEARLKGIIRSNENICIKNFEIYLDFVNRENSFSPESADILSEGYSQHVTKLINTFPDGDFKSLKTKVESLAAKATSQKLKASLTAINSLLESKVPVPAEAGQE